MNAVTCLTWVRRGVAKAYPDTIRLTDEELGKIVESAGKPTPPEAEGDSGDDASDAENRGTSEDNSNVTKTAEAKSGTEVDSIESKYHLEDYDDDDEDEGNDEDGALSMAALSFYPSNKQDPYIAKDEADSDDDDMQIAPNDNLIVIGKVHDEYFTLEVWINNVADGSLYCHHDTILSACPLALEWVGYDPGERGAGNLVAVGNMSPDIELWDLDVVNSLEPAFTLKGEGKRKKKKTTKKARTSPGHSDAVLGLSWNRNRCQILASASADESVGIWDLTQGSVVSFFRQHSDKVQAVHWHPVEDQLLLSGCYDGCVRLFDCRAPSADASRKWALGGEVEKVLWNHHDPFYLFAGTDSGELAYMDVRASTPVYTYAAHTAALTSLVLSSSLSRCLVTASDDQLLKVWDIGAAAEQPLLVTERRCKIGAIHCGGACPDESLLICVGGDREMKVINLQKDSKAAEHFGVADPAAKPAEPSLPLSPNATSGQASSKVPSAHKAKKLNRAKNRHSKAKKH